MKKMSLISKRKQISFHTLQKTMHSAGLLCLFRCDIHVGGTSDVFPIPTTMPLIISHAIVSLENLASLSSACQNQVIILSSTVALSGVKTFLVFLTNLHTLNRNSLHL